MFGFPYFDNFFIKKFILLLLFSFFVALLEVFSLTLLPIIFIMLKDYNNFLTLLSKIPIISGVNINAVVLDYESKKIIFYFCIFTLIVFITKAFLLFLYNFFNAKFSEKIKIDIVQLIFRRYFNIQYSILKIEQNSNLFNNIFHETEQLKLLVSEILLFFREILVIFFFAIVFIIFMQPFALFALLLLFIPNIVLLFVTRIKIRTFISKIHSSQPSFVKSIQEALFSIKESRIYNLSTFFIEQIKKNVTKLEYNNRWLNLSSLSLKIFLELTVVIIIIFIILFNFELQISSDKFLFYLSILFVAIYRLMPSVNIINSLIIKLALRKKSFINLRNFLKYKFIVNKKSEFKKIKMQKNSYFNISNLSFKYQNRNDYLLKNINYKKKLPIFLGILGPSGSGKSTLIDLIMGLVKPTNGGVYINNKNVFSLGKRWMSNISYVGQNIFLLDDSIKNNITFGEEEFDQELFSKVIKVVKLDKFIKSLPEKEFSIIGENGKFVSGGQVQRIAIARALYKNKPILILDEATNSIDLNTEKKIISNIKKLNKSIFIFITHQMSSYGKKNSHLKIE
jgi:ABC-type multidrug transport system fused ATPase/permease subunit